MDDVFHIEPFVKTIFILTNVQRGYSRDLLVETMDIWGSPVGYRHIWFTSIDIEELAKSQKNRSRLSTWVSLIFITKFNIIETLT